MTLFVGLLWKLLKISLGAVCHLALLLLLSQQRILASILLCSVDTVPPRCCHKSVNSAGLLKRCLMGAWCLGSKCFVYLLFVIKEGLRIGSALFN